MGSCDWATRPKAPDCPPPHHQFALPHRELQAQLEHLMEIAQYCPISSPKSLRHSGGS